MHVIMLIDKAGMLQSLLDDFVQHNVDTVCALLETSGRFLYRLPETHTRMANMAEVSTLTRLSP